MRVMYNVTGIRRKELVKAVGEAVGVPPRYLGAPSFAYEIGSYGIDRDGTLAVPVGFDKDAFDWVLVQLHMKGFVFEARESDEPEHVATEDMMVQPAAAPKSTAVEPPMESTDEQPFLTISMPLEGFTDAHFVNLEKLVAGKASLIKKALEVDELPITKEGDRLTFPWFHRALDSSEIRAYTHFIAALCEMAKRQKRVVVTDHEVDSEKFAFRGLLIRLGFNGAQYTAERKVLLRNLSGSCAFPNSAKAAEHAARWQEKNKARRDRELSNLPTQEGLE